MMSAADLEEAFARKLREMLGQFNDDNEPVVLLVKRVAEELAEAKASLVKARDEGFNEGVEAAWPLAVEASLAQEREFGHQLIDEVGSLPERIRALKRPLTVEEGNVQ